MSMDGIIDVEDLRSLLVALNPPEGPDHVHYE